MALLQLPACKNATANDNRCPYEGYECPNAQAAILQYETSMKDYQIELYNDTAWVYDGNRLVNTIVSPDGKFGAALDSTFWKDNE